MMHYAFILPQDPCGRSELSQRLRRRRSPSLETRTSEQRVRSRKMISAPSARTIFKGPISPVCCVHSASCSSDAPTMHCRFGCGGSIHAACLVEWAKHAASSGAVVILCPLCRIQMGSFTDIQQEARQAAKRSAAATKQAATPVNLEHFEHTDIACSACHKSPVTGKCYRCTSCSLYYNCQKCFVDGMHLAHEFQFRETLHSRWYPAVRPACMGAGLPGGIVQQLLARDITDADYDVLLQLDQPSMGTTLSVAAVAQLPSLSKCLTDQPCPVCSRKILPSQHCRKLQCQHLFHRDCIDPWLLHRKSSCPVDGSPVTPSSVPAKPHQTKPRPRRASTSAAEQDAAVALPPIFGRFDRASRMYCA